MRRVSFRDNDVEKIGLVQTKDVRKNNDTAMWLKVVRKST